MNDKERFEVLWIHHQRQQDENRAVSRALDLLRQDMECLRNEFAARTDRSYKPD